MLLKLFSAPKTISGITVFLFICSYSSVDTRVTSENDYDAQVPSTTASNGITNLFSKRPPPKATTGKPRRTTPRVTKSTTTATTTTIAITSTTSTSEAPTSTPLLPVGEDRPSKPDFPTVTLFSEENGSGASHRYTLGSKECGSVPEEWFGNVKSIKYDTPCIQLWEGYDCDRYTWCHCDKSGFLSLVDNAGGRLPWKGKLGSVTACALPGNGLAKNDIFFWG